MTHNKYVMRRNAFYPSPLSISVKRNIGLILKRIVFAILVAFSLPAMAGEWYSEPNIEWMTINFQEMSCIKAASMHASLNPKYFIETAECKYIKDKSVEDEFALFDCDKNLNTWFYLIKSPEACEILLTSIVETKKEIENE